jgi:hypothetical protein
MRMKSIGWSVEPQRHQHGVDDPGIAEDDAEREGAQNLVDPVGNDERDGDGPRAAARRRLGQVIGDRIADREVEDGDHRCGHDGAGKHPEVDEIPAVGVAGVPEQEELVVVEGVDVFRAADAGRRQVVAQREVEHRKLRQHDQEHDPEGDAGEHEGRQAGAIAMVEPGEQSIVGRSSCADAPLVPADMTLVPDPPRGCGAPVPHS